MPPRGYMNYWTSFDQFKVSFNYGEYEVSTTVDARCSDRMLIELKARQKLTVNGFNLDGVPCTEVIGVRRSKEAV